jgi:hypothetical protein
MKLVKLTGPEGSRGLVRCVGPNHQGIFGTRMIPVADAYADLDGKAFVDFYCKACRPDKAPTFCTIPVPGREGGNDGAG